MNGDMQFGGVSTTVCDRPHEAPSCLYGRSATSAKVPSVCLVRATDRFTWTTGRTTETPLVSPLFLFVIYSESLPSPRSVRYSLSASAPASRSVIMVVPSWLCRARF